jgi:hypothetical protein
VGDLEPLFSRANHFFRIAGKPKLEFHLRAWLLCAQPVFAGQNFAHGFETFAALVQGAVIGRVVAFNFCDYVTCAALARFAPHHAAIFDGFAVFVRVPLKRFNHHFVGEATGRWADVGTRAHQYALAVVGFLDRCQHHAGEGGKRKAACNALQRICALGPLGEVGYPYRHGVVVAGKLYQRR